jgi:hypothetical protein
MRRSELLLHLGFGVGAVVGGGTVYLLATFTAIGPLALFVIGVLAGLVGLVIYVLIVAKLRL